LVVSTVRIVPVLLADLLAAPGLNLVAVAGSAPALRRAVRWCAVTELADPRPWLQGGELVLTTGLRQRTAAAQREFVARVAERGVAGIGFGTGLSHERVPRATLAAAQAAGLPVLEVPYETPFLAVDRFVADWISAESYRQQRDLLEVHDALARALLSGGGLDSLLRVLRQVVGVRVAVIDSGGTVLAADGAGEAPPAVPIVVAGTVVAHLCTPARHDVLPYAASLVGLELARRQAVLAGRRELVGQVIEDIVRATLSEGEAARRLAAFGVDLTRPHTVLLAAAGPEADPGGERLRGLPGGVYPLSPAGAEPVVTAHAGEHLVVVAGDEPPVEEVARQTLGYVAQLGGDARVGIGGAYPGVAGLRWSFYEAREALTRGPGVNAREPLSLPGLLLASDSLPLAELGRAVLAPLLDFDGQGGGAALVETLRAYLEEDASVTRVAGRLFVHRNTVRYRLEQIERLTGRSLGSTQDRVQFWLALHAVSLGGR
jgi:PucR family transcriptional regulator, purine catabolism regulatory protein